MTDLPPPFWQILPERPEDEPAVEALSQLSFGPGCHARSAYRLREGVDPVRSLSFVASAEEGLVGSIRFWPVVVGKEPSLLLGPLVVEPRLRGLGIGIALMKAGIGAARSEGHSSIILVGDEPYYVRVGFARLPPGKVRLPGPVDPMRVLGLSLKVNTVLTLSGEVRRAALNHRVTASGAGTAA